MNRVVFNYIVGPKKMTKFARPSFISACFTRISTLFLFLLPPLVHYVGVPEN